MTARASVRPDVAALLSAVVPGLGQLYAGRWRRGVAILLTILFSALAVIWHGVPGWWLAPAVIWMWAVWDAWGVSVGLPRSAIAPVMAILAMSYGIGWTVAQIDPGALTRNLHRAGVVLGPMVHPDLISPRQETQQIYVTVEVPCSADPPGGNRSASGLTLTASSGCAGAGEQLPIAGSGFWPGPPVELWWEDSIGERARLLRNREIILAEPDAAGMFAEVIVVPQMRSGTGQEANLEQPLPERLIAIQRRPIGGYQITENGQRVISGIFETISLALMATTLSIFGAVPLGFLAARNLTGAGLAGWAVYAVTRTILNVLRSIEPLIIAIVFVVTVGLGPFAGMLAIMTHSIAALGKLYSEAVESIDPGPIEAVWATGASWLEVVRYSVVPQVMPPFVAFTLYRWDINVRSSIIIGFVGGGGIGAWLFQWINLGDYRAVGASFVAIVIVVMALDFASARVRERVI